MLAVKEHTGAMIAFFVPEAARETIVQLQTALPAGTDLVPAEELHLTLCYLGEAADLAGVKTWLLAELAGSVRWRSGIVGTLAGYARFTSEDGRDALVLLVDSPWLPSLYQDVQQAAGESGAYPPMKHGFIPHITLGYLPSGAETPQLAVPLEEIPFEKLALAWGDEITRMPLYPAIKAASEGLTVFKDAKGQWRWVGITSSSYEDRDAEIVTLKALEADVARADADGDYGPLNWWHIQGLNIGDCDFNMTLGRFLVESGTFHSEAVGKAVAAQATDLGFSIEFLHPPGQPDAGGAFNSIRRIGRALLPRGKASNRFTSVLVARKEENMTGLAEKLTELINLTGSKETVEGLLDTALEREKTAQAAGVAHKEAEKDPPPTTPQGEVTLDDSNIAEVIKEALAPLFQERAEKEAALDTRLKEQGAQVAALQTTVKTMQGQLAELLGEQPNAARGYRASQDEGTVAEAREKEGPAADPLNSFIDTLFNPTAAPPVA
jgi:2'-5' RNA ligase